MNYKLINRICYGGAILSVLSGTLIGLLALWVVDLMSQEFATRCFSTTVLLFIASILGAIVTRLLVASDDPAAEAAKDLKKMTVAEFVERRDKGES